MQLHVTLMEFFWTVFRVRKWPQISLEISTQVTLCWRNSHYSQRHRKQNGFKYSFSGLTSPHFFQNIWSLFVMCRHPLAMWSKAWLKSRFIAGIADPAEVTSVDVLNLLCVVMVVATATSWSLVKRSPTGCVCPIVCDLETSTISHLGSSGGVAPHEKILKCAWGTYSSRNLHRREGTPGWVNP